MKRWQRWMIAAPALLLCVAATQWAMRGIHTPTGNAGYLGTEAAGVEGVMPTFTNTMSAVKGTHVTTSSVGHLGFFGIGVLGSGPTGVAGQGTEYGVRGVGAEADSVGVKGEGDPAIYGVSPNGFAVFGTTNEGTGVYGVVGGGGHAGFFQGRVHVNGTLSKSAGSFRIDHPLDPERKYLSHSFVESPDMKNIYDGVVTLGSDGSAVVELPEWFDALNRDFRYQLTCIGEHAPVYVAEEIRENRFRIAGGYAAMKVSWQVTGSRDDAYARAYPIVVEEDKAAGEVGKFLHPELYKQPVAQRIGPNGRSAR